MFISCMSKDWNHNFEISTSIKKYKCMKPEWKVDNLFFKTYLRKISIMDEAFLQSVSIFDTVKINSTFFKC